MIKFKQLEFKFF